MPDQKTDPNGCYTLPNGDCVSEGPCMHKPAMTREQGIQERVETEYTVYPIRDGQDPPFDETAALDDITYLLARVAAVDKAISSCDELLGIIDKNDSPSENILAIIGALILDRVALKMKNEKIAKLTAAQATNAQRDARLVRAHGALKLALEYWAHRQQRYKNRHPVWVEAARAALAIDDAVIAAKIGEVE